MRVSQDVTFDESRPFFPCFSSSSSSTTTESISFLTLPDESLLLPSTPPSPSYAPSIVPPPPPISLLSRFLGLLPSRFLLPLLCLLHCPLVLLLWWSLHARSPKHSYFLSKLSVVDPPWVWAGVLDIYVAVYISLLFLPLVGGPLCILYTCIFCPFGPWNRLSLLILTCTNNVKF